VTGDLLVTMPEAKVLMAVDIYTPDCLPLIDFDATQDMYGYMKTLDLFLEILANTRGRPRANSRLGDPLASGPWS